MVQFDQHCLERSTELDIGDFSVRIDPLDHTVVALEVNRRPRSLVECPRRP
jgi:hypothetical protein